MKKEKLIASAIAIILLGSCNNQPKDEPLGGNGLPQDVKQSCTIDSADFNKWFADGKASTNGFVDPANSVAFDPSDNCNFYKWSEQMFLWITSQDSRYGNDHSKTVMESPVFYTVGPDTNNNFVQSRILYPHKQGGILRASASITQAGPHKLPVIVDKNGKMFEVETQKPNEKAMVQNAEGKIMAVASVRTEANGNHTFLTADNNPIQGAKAVIKHNGGNFVQRLKDEHGNNVFLDANGNEIQAETGQATNQLLVAQNGSVVYYLLFVNDVYAYYQGGVTSPNKITLNPNEFPTTAGARDSVCALARANGATLPDSNALAIELKTSWVEAKDLPDAESNYIIIDAVIPTYKMVGQDSSGKYIWMLDSEKKTKLAMIGMHIVGSVNKHPEMIWSTFEHRKNAPNAQYRYIDNTGKVKTVPQDSGTNWLLSANASAKDINVQHQAWSFSGGDTIFADSAKFLPSNVLRTEPWGSALDSITNQEDTTSAASNSEIIAINNAIYNLLPGNDVRKNYWLTGSTWTFGGRGPTGNVYSSADLSNPTPYGVGIGTNVTANSTMETYIQGPHYSCFTCHSAGSSLNPDSISHIFQFIVPLKLPNVPTSMMK